MQSWAPAFFSRFCAREREAIKKAREHEEKKSAKKAKAPSAKEKKRQFALFFLGGTFVCMYVLLYVLYLRMYICM
jgi:hypothetical protein